MSDILNIGASALLAYQRALATTGHNIANASTEGYSRQRVELVARVGAATGAGFTGAGVEATTVVRLTDSFATERLRFDAANFGQQETLQLFTARVDQLLSDKDLGLTDPLAQFFAAVDGVAANPTDAAARQVLLSKADVLTRRFQSLQREFDNLDQEINRRLQQSVSEINTLARSIADMNSRVATAGVSIGEQPPNDLLDQREQLLQELAGKIGITTVMQDDGAINVFTADGQPLVLGQRANALTTAQDDYNAGRLELVFGSGAGAVPITSSTAGGEVGGLLAFRRDVLDPAAGKLGRLAAALAEPFNAQHRDGLDLYGDLGDDFFVAPQPTSFANVNNAGSAAIGVTYADVGQLTGDNYLLRFDGASWQLQQPVTGAVVSLSGSGTAADPFIGAGLSIVVSGAAAAGDSFLIQPTSDAAGDLAVALSDPSRIAAAAPIRTEAALSNTGQGTISAGEVLDVSDPNLRTSATIQFVSASSFTIDGSGPFAYTPGANIDFQGWRVQIGGTPAAGDSFQVLPVPANSGDNRNARLLADFRTLGVVDGGTRSLNAGYGSLVAQVGTQAQQANSRLQAQAAIREHDQTARDNVAGVNLDEEAANLVRFQQAYQAAAQIIAVADTVFQSLLRAVGR